MILPFSQFFDKEKQKPTYFAEKIWSNDFIYVNHIWYKDNKYKQSSLIYSKIMDCKPKIHTIRKDEKNR